MFWYCVATKMFWSQYYSIMRCSLHHCSHLTVQAALPLYSHQIVLLPDLCNDDEPAPFGRNLEASGPEATHFKADSWKLVGRNVQLLCKHRGERLYPERLGENGHQECSVRDTNLAASWSILRHLY